MRRVHGFCCAVGLLLGIGLASPAAAQSPAPAPSVAAAAVPSLAPTTEAVRLGIATDVREQPTTVNASAARMSRRDGRVMALVGAAAVVTGILVGGDAGTVIAIGGAGLGLYGLYVWQR